MMFCPKCGSLLLPRKDNGAVVLSCACGYTNKKKEAVKIKEVIKAEAEIMPVEKEEEVNPLTGDAECPKCGHKMAYYWEVQTRASDEPATKFLKCEKCRHIWRDYK